MMIKAGMIGQYSLYTVLSSSYYIKVSQAAHFLSHYVGFTYPYSLYILGSPLIKYLLLISLLSLLLLL